MWSGVLLSIGYRHGIIVYRQLNKFLYKGGVNEVAIQDY
ncbi:hypothetical protein VP424E501_P0302 [Vibrio phage 424E50-1]|nr:hypothetical protein VP424E501_P0302 [Vibrio phage 424E50-1]